jgi:CubicO group peptidase (beta-lactamase class C family)
MKTIWKVSLTVLGLLAAVIVGFLLLVYIPSPKFEPLDLQPQQPDYWPTAGFQASTPEEQGMDSEILVEMLDAYQAESPENPELDIDSITIIRNGYLVGDYYFDSLYPRDALHVMHSCTKSVLSALIGIAIDQGYIESVDLLVVSFFPDKLPANMDIGMAEVTISDLLSMQTGIRSRDSYLYNYQGLFAAQNTDDWVRYTLSLPMDAEPGSRFDYSNLSSFLLSAILQEATGMDALAFARENLFGPLGITDVRWDQSPQGIYIGWARMWLKPHDMAKIGLLFLQGGEWEGHQVISREWIQESLTPHAFPKNYHDVLDQNGEKDQMPSGENWVAMKFLRPYADGYGYQWWLDRDGSYTALGTAGQYILVSPEENLVAVVTGQSSGMGSFQPAKYFRDYIREAVISDQALDPNPAALAALDAYGEPPVLAQEPNQVPVLPPMAMGISGDIYVLDENNWNYDNFQLVFPTGKDYVIFSYTAKVDDQVSYQVGLDNTYHFTDTGIGQFAARGEWTAPDRFEIHYQQIGYSNPGSWILTFKKYAIEVVEVGVTGRYEYSGVLQR